MAVPSTPKNPASPGAPSGARAVAPVMVGQGTAMARLRELLGAVAARECTVMLHGPSGSGKELAARTIHALSGRAAAPFVAVDCTGLRDTLLESQLFGHVKGAFTGADVPALGFIRAADGGTLFLDEIGEMEPKTQAKFLRVLQERTVVPLGATRPVPVDVRVVCASHRDLRALAARGEFREDLLFRLDVVKISLPSLAERPEDIEPLAEHFVGQLADLYGEPARGISAGARAALRAYGWPGNVRELANAVEHAVVFCRGDEIEVADLPERVRGAVVGAGASAAGAPGAAGTTGVRENLGEWGGEWGVQRSGALAAGAEAIARVPTLEQMERELIERALRITNGNQNSAAAMLQIERRRLYRKVSRYGLRPLVNKRAEG
jgi:DNA-binding NtrC family response regulator